LKFIYKATKIISIGIESLLKIQQDSVFEQMSNLYSQWDFFTYIFTIFVAEIVITTDIGLNLSSTNAIYAQKVNSSFISIYSYFLHYQGAIFAI